MTGLIQRTAVRAAEKEDVVIEAAALGSAEATTIAHIPARNARPPRPERLKVALLGCGDVGAGVLAFLKAQPQLFEVNSVLVRRPDRHFEEARFTDRAAEALAGNPDILIETLSGVDFPADVMRTALRAGAQVVTANSAAVARHYESLHAAAERGEGALRFSAAVGGGAPVLEALGRSEGQVFGVAVVNGTSNYILSRLAEGWTFEEALKQAQTLRYAGAGLALDIDGNDTADKLSLITRVAFGVALQPEKIRKASLREVDPSEAIEALARGKVMKRVGLCGRAGDGSIAAEVRLITVGLDQPLAGGPNEENRFLVTDNAGRLHTLAGKGAGHRSTAAAVFADVMDAQRALLGRPMWPSRLPNRSGSAPDGGSALSSCRR